MELKVYPLGKQFLAHFVTLFMFLSDILNDLFDF